jgi:serine/threonine protein kinase
VPLQPLHLPEAAPVFDSAFRSASAAEERFSVGDTSKPFLEAQRDTLTALIARAGARWAPVKGHTAVDGVMRLGNPEINSDFEFSNIALGPLRENHRVFLGRWRPQPLADGGARVRPRLVPENGYVAVKFVEGFDAPPSLSVDDAAAVAAAGGGAAGAISIVELETHRRLQVLAHRSGLRFFCDLVDCFAVADWRGRITVTLIQELCVATLANRLALSSAFPLGEKERFSIAWRVSRSLAFMHAPPTGDNAGFIHRDVRVSNVFIDASGAVLLADFGEARAAHQAIDLPQSPDAQLRIHAQARHDQGAAVVDMSSTSMRRRAHMTCQPREVYDGDARTVTTATDVWQLGQLLFMLFSRDALRPFVSEATQLRGDNERFAAIDAEHKAAVLEGREPLWRHLRVDTPPSMVALIAWCLESDASRRPSMAAVLGHPAFWSLSQHMERVQVVRSALGNGHGGIDGPGLKRLFAFIDAPQHHLDADPAEVPSVVDALAGHAVAANAVSREAPDGLLQFSDMMFDYARDQGLAAAKPLAGRERGQCHFHFPSAANGTAAMLLVWLRNLYSHVHDDEVVGDDALRFAMTRLGRLCHGRETHNVVWTEPAEVTLRHPACAWLVPLLYKLLVANRASFLRGDDAVPRDVLAMLLPQALLRAQRALPAPMEGALRAAAGEGDFAHAEGAAPE